MAGTDRPPGPGVNKRAQAKRQVALQFGLSAESRAAACLLLKGYRILARRFKTMPFKRLERRITAHNARSLILQRISSRSSGIPKPQYCGPHRRPCSASRSWCGIQVSRWY